MSDDIDWPEEIWLAELDQHHNGWGSVMLSEFGTGCPQTDREFQRYVDADIYDSATKYWADRDAQRLERIAELEAALESIANAPAMMLRVTMKDIADAALSTGQS